MNTMIEMYDRIMSVVEEVTGTFNFIQSIRKGEPIINTPTTPPVDIPPLPTE